MSRVLFDTSVYSRAMRGDTWCVSVMRDADELLLCPVIVGELLSGFRRGQREGNNRAVFRKFLASPRVVPVPIVGDTAEFYCNIVEGLRANGTPIPTNDIWIAASAMEHGALLATADQHFEHVPGLLTLFPNTV